MHPTEQQQRVVGQLVLVFRESLLLNGSRDVDYRIDEHGAVEVRWTSGPFASEVAAELAAYGAIGLLHVDAVTTTASTTGRVHLLISDVPVVLHAFEPIGKSAVSRRTFQTRPSEKWYWPSPLEEEGVARDQVLWTLELSGDLVATVIRIPYDRPNDINWSEGGQLVAVSEDDRPKGLSPARRAEVSGAWEICSILLRYAPKGMSDDDADTWMAEELGNSFFLRMSVAVIFRDRCIMRDWSGFRVEATMMDTATTIPWSIVPSALRASTFRFKRSRNVPPTTLHVREFGGRHSMFTVSTAVTWHAPSSFFSKTSTYHEVNRPPAVGEGFVD
ncbi:hypothetical protein [Kutzneria sp. NPDC051319]|uniref:hypothetical protein n=1 Tax=Kutzneria sp. NPDC051319 TaxID=3155047 RepID=UPI00342A91F2